MQISLQPQAKITIPMEAVSIISLAVIVVLISRPIGTNSIRKYRNTKFGVEVVC
jgi:hypothetical protein